MLEIKFKLEFYTISRLSNIYSFIQKTFLCIEPNRRSSDFTQSTTQLYVLEKLVISPLFQREVHSIFEQLDIQAP